MDILSDKNVKARKKHCCDFCGREIQVGEIYRKTTVKDDDLYDWKIHLYCDELSHKLEMYDSYSAQTDGITSYDFREYVWDYFREAYDGYDSSKKYSWEDALRFALGAFGLICI